MKVYSITPKREMGYVSTLPIEPKQEKEEISVEKNKKTDK